MYEPARNLRTAERFLLAPPLAATFGAAAVAVCDISAQGARFRHDRPIETGTKAILQVPIDGRSAPVALEAMVVWTQADATAPGKQVSGARTWGATDAFITQLKASARTQRIEELRASDRFHLKPPLPATFDSLPVTVEDLSARGARIVLPASPERGARGSLYFTLPQSDIEVSVAAQVVWSSVKAMAGAVAHSYRAGLMVNEKRELMRLAIGRLCEMNRAALDTQSLRLKVKILRARARQMAPSYREIEASGVPAEQYLLVQGVREELRLNPEEAMHWYRRARIVISDPSTRSIAPPIASHPDALAVWEYLDRSVDPSIVGRVFEL